MHPKHILLAVDGSDNALRAAEYLGTMLGGLPGFSVTLAAVERLPSRDLFASDGQWAARCAEESARLKDGLAAARSRLAAAGFAPASLGERYVPSCHGPEPDAQACAPGESVARTLLDLALEAEAGTLVLGRRGISKKEEFLFGSVSSRVIRGARGCTVWVVE